ncbi:hypothetical protein [Planococcus faecalis]|uniref:hypothetical protein n=1 Tax=Planococcus faecalis TaxID=1598147 RepID=UPI0008DA6E39|nr:hypothetical protein [Planococcus faecalis]OHX51665.1 hypothetical protein BB777_15960 [Planococcus faecalis]
MGIKSALTASRFRKAVESGNTSKVFEMISQDKDLSKRFLNEFVDSDNFLNQVKEAMSGWKEVLNQNASANSEVAGMIRETRTGLQNYLDQNIENLNREERKDVLIQIMELAKMMSEFDKDNKNFLLGIAGFIGGTLTIVGVAALAILSPTQNVIDMAEDDEEDIN